MKIINTIIDPPISVFLVGSSEIKNQTQRGPKAVSRRKKIPTSGEVTYFGAIVIKRNDTPTVIIINKENNRSNPPMTNVVAKGRATTAVKNLANI
tara:strand:- start:46 stop:330 length:285 start_codon:yes stop_codon:yes gene_type:complete